MVVSVAVTVAVAVAVARGAVGSAVVAAGAAAASAAVLESIVSARWCWSFFGRERVNGDDEEKDEIGGAVASAKMGVSLQPR